ncbi:MAG: CHAT domain-containing protein [Acidobacteria bacterium]|nr:CHAT domain-containing protein [Acidobacteriota bacterium]
MTSDFNVEVPREKLVEELIKATDTVSLRGFLSRHRSLLPPDLVEKLAEVARENLRVNAQESLRIADAALVVADEIGTTDSKARALRAKANALWFLNHNKEAVELYDQAISLFQSTNNCTEIGRTISSSIQPLIRLGEYERALQGAERARQIFTDSGDGLRLARLELNVANIYHRQDRFAEAEAMYERAYQKAVEFKDAEAIGVALHNMAVCLINLNDFQRALDTYERARAFCREHGMPALVAQADYNIAYLHYLRGEYNRALEMLQAAREASRNTGDSYHSALCNLDQSEIYLELNLSNEAAEMAQEAFAQFKALGMRYEAARSVANLAIALGQQGNTSRALELFAQAKEIFEKENHQVWPFLVDLYQALVLYRERRCEEAQKLCGGALDFFETHKLPSKQVICQLLQAGLFVCTNELDAARVACAKAMSVLGNLDASHLAYQAYFLMGQIAEAAGQDQEAADWYQAARSEMESLRSVLRGEELKIAFMTNKLDVYEGLVRLALAGGDSARAFEFIEQAKSRSLRDILSEHSGSSSPEQNGQSELLQNIKNLRQELNWYYHRIELEEVNQEAASPRKVEELRMEAQEHEKKLLRTMRELPAATSHPGRVPAPHPVNVESIRMWLGADASLVEFFRLDQQIIAAVLTAQHLEIVPLLEQPKLRSALELLQFQLAKFRLAPEYLEACGELLLASTQRHLRELYEMLIAPIRPQLRGTRLIISPHGLLHYLPFHALFDGNQYLLDSFLISYAPSASIYALSQEVQVNRSGSSLVLGIPNEQAPFIREEVQYVADELPQPETFVGASATESVLREKAPRSRIVHIATHGRFRADNPMFSSVRLGDSHLTLYDLHHLNMPVELATLSGCSTGLSIVAAGDELLGLVRGLLQSGAQTLLLTLWDVHDRTTADFMKMFYRELRRTPDKSLALRNAVNELRQTRPHPYYWAPYVLIGKG